MTTGHRLATALDRPEESTGLLLWQVTNRWQAAQRATLKPFGLTHVQFVLLASLTWLGSEGPVSQRELAGHARTDPMMTSQVVRVLEGRGLLVRRPDQADRRVRSLAVTDRGADLVNRAVGAVEACDEEFFRPLVRGRGAFTRSLGALAGSSVGGGR